MASSLTRCAMRTGSRVFAAPRATTTPRSALPGVAALSVRARDPRDVARTVGTHGRVRCPFLCQGRHNALMLDPMRASHQQPRVLPDGLSGGHAVERTGTTRSHTHTLPLIACSGNRVPPPGSGAHLMMDASSADAQELLEAEIRAYGARVRPYASQPSVHGRGRCAPPSLGSAPTPMVGSVAHTYIHGDVAHTHSYIPADPSPLLSQRRV